MSEDSAQLNSLLKDAKLVDHQEVESFNRIFKDGDDEYGARLADHH